MTQQQTALSAEEQAVGWYLYRFFTRLPCAVPGCRMKHPLYIGKSNDPLRRWLEHAPKQPWWSAQCGYEIDEQVYGSDREVRAAETAAIRAELPLGNVAGNEGNRHRLDFGGQVSRPARGPVASPQFSRRIPSPPRREWSRRQRQAAAVAAVWLLLAAGGWWAVCRWLPVGLAAGAVDGAVAGSTLLTLAGALALSTKGKGAARRKFWRILGLGAAATGAMFLLWHTGLATMLLKLAIMPVEIV